ncbi:MAG: helix-turn-helix transcriptional regulator [Chloroflexota bacterium]|nr:MAG: XRE family transcriptional regulator [Chloroflexota bacterium]
MRERKKIFRGDRLREMRRKRQLTQDELAERLGFGQSQMNKYENGKSDPTPEVLVRLARELEVTTDWLLGLVDDPTSHLQERDLTAMERKLLSAFRRGDFKELVRIAVDHSVASS